MGIIKIYRINLHKTNKKISPKKSQTKREM